MMMRYTVCAIIIVTNYHVTLNTIKHATFHFTYHDTSVTKQLVMQHFMTVTMQLLCNISRMKNTITFPETFHDSER
uniref:Uncharacterized protein n=1 Tax=Arion vulgaris TaxID=1028688 RepID=A0A0B6YWV8_9EUPU